MEVRQYRIFKEVAETGSFTKAAANLYITQSAVSHAVAELEREYILQRQREGIAIAKAEGKYTGRKPVQHPDLDKVLARWQKGEITAVQARKQLGMSKATFYRRAKKSS